MIDDILPKNALGVQIVLAQSEFGKAAHLQIADEMHLQRGELAQNVLLFALVAQIQLRGLDVLRQRRHGNLQQLAVFVKGERRHMDDLPAPQTALARLVR